MSTCDVCGSRNCPVQQDRIAGACIAMFRFSVWVWCEAEADVENGPWIPDRRQALARALELGLLRLEWKR